MGRPTKFPEERRKANLENLENGVTREVALRASGGDPETLRKWIRNGEEAITVAYFRFAIIVAFCLDLGGFPGQILVHL